MGLTVFYLADFIVCVRARLGGAEDEEPVIGRLKVLDVYKRQCLDRAAVLNFLSPGMSKR